MKTTYWILSVWWAHNKEVIDESLMRHIVTKMGVRLRCMVKYPRVGKSVKP